jgi:hypothetical protein
MRDASQGGCLILAFTQSIDRCPLHTSAKAYRGVSIALSSYYDCSTYQTPGLSALNLTTKLPCGLAMKVSLRIGVAGNSVWLFGS